MTFIIKRISGDREEFEAGKIRKAVTKAYIDAGVNVGERKGEIDGVVNYVIDMFKARDAAIPTKEIRELTLRKLDSVRPEVADAWRKFEERYKKH